MSEGESIPVPRVGELVRSGDEVKPIEAVTWDFQNTGTVTVTLLVGDRPYAY